jgi:hypothetical protein
MGKSVGREAAQCRFPPNFSISFGVRMMRISRSAGPTLVTRTDAQNDGGARVRLQRMARTVLRTQGLAPFRCQATPFVLAARRVWSMNRLMAALYPSYHPHHAASSDHGLFNEKYADSQANDSAAQRAELARTDRRRPRLLLCAISVSALGSVLKKEDHCKERSRLMSCRALFRGDPTDYCPPQIGVDVPACLAAGLRTLRGGSSMPTWIS